MSKAFTRESDDGLDSPLAGKPAAVLPAGTPNYFTPDGVDRLRDELDRLFTEDRPALQRAGTEENSGAMRRIDQRIREISEALNSAQITPPPARPWYHVAFGAIVTARKVNREQVTYRIVGVNEVDLDRSWVSWLTPVAKALLNSQVGERVPLNLPGEKTELEILEINYPEPDSKTSS